MFATTTTTTTKPAFSVLTLAGKPSGFAESESIHTSGFHTMAAAAVCLLARRINDPENTHTMQDSDGFTVPSSAFLPALTAAVRVGEEEAAGQAAYRADQAAGPDVDIANIDITVGDDVVTEETAAIGGAFARLQAEEATRPYVAVAVAVAVSGDTAGDYPGYVRPARFDRSDNRFYSPVGAADCSEHETGRRLSFRTSTGLLLDVQNFADDAVSVAFVTRAAALWAASCGLDGCFWAWSSGPNAGEAVYVAVDHAAQRLVTAEIGLRKAQEAFAGSPGASRYAALEAAMLEYQQAFHTHHYGDKG